MVKEMKLDLSGGMFKAFSPRSMSVEEKKLAKALVEDAENHVAEGRRQRHYAQMAGDLMNQAAGAESRRELARIAAWHFKASGDSFRQSAQGFESAARLQKNAKAQRKLLSEAGEMAELVLQAETAVYEIEEFQRREAKV